MVQNCCGRIEYGERSIDVEAHSELVVFALTAVKGRIKATYRECDAKIYE
jgi:hypothetical protein